MFGPNTHNVENEATRRRDAAHTGPEQDGGSSNPTIASAGTADFARLARSSNISASYNGSVRAAAMQGMQQTHGNHAVQRSISTGGAARRTSVQRTPSGPDTSIGYDPNNFMYQSQPLSPLAEPSFMSQPQPFGPEAAPAYGPDMATAQESEYGEVCEMEDVASNEASIQSGTPVQEADGNAYNPVGDTNNAVSAGTTVANTMMLGSSVFQDLPKVAEDFNVLSLAKGGSSALNTGTSALGVGVGIYNFIKADNTADRVQAGADTLASGAGFAGPYGMAFSGGYSAGQLLDKGADWIGDKIWGEGDHSLHHGLAEHVLPHILPSAQSIRDSWEVFRGRGTEAQQENAENRKFAVELDHIREARKDRERKAQDEQEIEEMRSQIAHPHVGGTMLGTPGDALSGSSIAEQFMPHEVDEDGNPLPHVSMALPEPQGKRR